MTFISYAQNYEDVMLWRALKHIEKGFYIDVGAAWPDEHSVTKVFYEAGWHGINIEPNDEYIEQYKKNRKDDINLPVAVSDANGEVDMFFISGTGLSSLNQEIAEGHSELGWETTPSTVDVRTLADICSEYCPKKDIHFLKVDIEGFEEQALKGNDWSKFRPWIVVVEAMLPMSQVENYKDWESILLDANYIFAYADGLNRFYVSSEHKELLPAFKYTPNVFDGFRLISGVKAEAKAEQAEVKATQFHAELLAVYSSRSWQVTAPIRWGVFQVKLLRQYGFLLRVKSLIKTLYTLKKDVIISIPFLEQSNGSRENASPLTPHAKRIYRDLKEAVDKNTRNK